MSNSDEYVPTQPQDSSRIKFPALDEEDNKLPQLGDLLLNKYKITAKKEGGFGAVLFVTDISTNQKYAVKTYKLKLIDTLPSREQFKGEVDLWINLDPHPNIVKAHFAEFIEDRLFLFMEYVSGGTLRDVIQRLTIQEVIKFAYQICLAMEFVNRNRQKIVHADLKPENILITPSGIAKITDFGLAKPFQFFEDNFPREFSGTIQYMSPEQLCGEVLDEKSDIFSYGIMFYEMVMGKLPYPFDTKGLETTAQWRDRLKTFYGSNDRAFTTDDYRFVPWNKMPVNGDVEHLVLGCIFPKRNNRWPYFRELRQAFEFKFPELVHYRTTSSEIIDLHQKALSLYKIGNLSIALNTFNKALKMNPNSAELWRDAAIVLVEAEMLSAAQNFLDRAKELNPSIDIDHPNLELLLSQR